MNILIIKPSSLGDVVQALPALKILQARYPHARIDWLINEELGDILIGNPHLRAIHLWDRKSWRKPHDFFKALRNAAAVVRKLRRAHYDLVLDLQGLFRSGLIAFLSRAEKVIGFADAREMAPLFYHEKVEAPVDQMHSVERYVIAAGGDRSGEKEFPIALSARDERTTNGLLAGMGYDAGRPLVVLVPGGRWLTKRWPEEKFAALARMLIQRRSAQVGLVGSAGDKETIRRITFRTGRHSMDFSGRTTLRQLACLLKKADVVMGNDSGPIHIAAAVGTRVVALYGPTSPERTGPYGPQHTVLTSDLPCSPCFRRECDVSTACMGAISVDSVYCACEPYLRESKKTGKNKVT